jgi:hypothetical protein
MKLSEIIRLAKKEGCDLITVEPDGDITKVTCERRMHAVKTVEVIEASFYDHERALLEELNQAGLDARFTSNGIRAFGKQDNSAIDAIIYGKSRLYDSSIAREFQPQGIHRDDFNQPKEEPKPKRHWYPCY